MNDQTQFTEEQRAEMFREFQSEHLKRQTRAIEQIRNYVGIWFWLTVAGVSILLVLSILGSRGY